MSAEIINDPPGRIGPLASGWNVVLDAMPHSASAGSPSTGVINFVADADHDSHLAMNNHSQFIFTDLEKVEVPDVWIGAAVGVPPVTIVPTGPDPAGYGNLPYDSGSYGGAGGKTPAPTGSSLGNDPSFGSLSFGADYFGGVNLALSTGYNVGGYGTAPYNSYGNNGAITTPTQVYQSSGELDITASINGRIDSVSVQGASATYTQGTLFTPFSTVDIGIPAVTSGSPVAAFNLAWQLAGNNPCQLSYTLGRYWSLRGHDAGFDVKNKAVVPKDASTYKLAGDGKTIFRKWLVQDSYTALGWTVADGEFWSTAGIGSSITLERLKRTAIISTINLNQRSFSFQFGGSTSPEFLGFGPDDAHAGTGKWFNIDLHGPALNATLTGQYRSGGSYVSISKSVSLSGIDITQPVQLILDIGYQEANQFFLHAYVQNIDSLDPPIMLSTGTLVTNMDVFAAPWKTAGLMHGLYVTTGTYGDFDPYDLRGDYEDWSAQPLCDLDSYGMGAPILPFSGSLWDYLSQISVARQVGLRQVNNRFSISAMSDDGITAQLWHPAVTPTLAIDDSNTAVKVDVQGKRTLLEAGPVIFDAMKQSQSYSVAPGATTQFTITTTTINGLVYNPEPLFDFNDFMNGHHPYGAYIVSSANKNRIVVTEWVNYGGSVSVAQTDVNTLTVTIVAPNIPLPNGGSSGNYTISVETTNNSFAMLRLTTPAGGEVTDNTISFETGASYAGTNTSSATITNVAATDPQSIQNCAAWAIAQATGPNITLNGEFPLDDLRRWRSSDFGMIPGSTILYRNMQWRIMTATISNLGVQFTAAPFLTYQSDYFAVNWDKFTVDDYALYWEGKTYDDMATMALSGPNYDWTSDGALARFTLYPGGGSESNDPGLLPDPLLQADPLLEPDAPGSTTVGSMYPNSTEYPNSSEYTFPTTPSTSGFVYPMGNTLFPGSEEDE